MWDIYSDQELDFFIRTWESCWRARVPIEDKQTWDGGHGTTDHLVTTTTNGRPDTWKIFQWPGWPGTMWSGQHWSPVSQRKGDNSSHIRYSDDKRHNISIHWPVAESSHPSSDLSLVTIEADIGHWLSCKVYLSDCVTFSNGILIVWTVNDGQWWQWCMVSGCGQGMVTMTHTSQVYD